jgi:hypothetical protein
MKKIFIILLTILFIKVNAQNQQNEKVIGIQTGISWTGILFNNLTLDKLKLDYKGINLSAESFDANSSAALGVSFDFGISNMISIGGLYARQPISGEIGSYSWVNLKGENKTETIQFNAVRNNITILPKIHYNLNNDKIDLYSGLRVGYTFWNVDFIANDPNFNVFEKIIPRGRPSIGIIPIALRYYITDNLGVNVEPALGAPYVASIGAQYRF